TRLDPHVDVLADQDDLALGLCLCEMAHDAEDLVVGLARGEGGWQLAAYRIGLQEQAASRLLRAVRGQLDARVDVVSRMTQQLVEKAARLAGVARHFGHALL